MSTTVTPQRPATIGAPRVEAATDLSRDLILLLARIGLGILMIWHSKIVYDFSGSVSAYVGGFDQMGVPFPELTARANLVGEVVGGAALILGAGVRLVGVLMALNMVGAWIYVHTSGLYSMDGNGPETVIAVGLLALVLAVTGSGRLGLDHLWRNRMPVRRSAGA